MHESHGIIAVDTGFQRPHFDAAYLIVEQGRAAFVDCGTQHSVPRMLAALAAQGLEPDAVDWLMLTHVHLDHAGGAGALMQQLPNARLVVHPRGAPHMLDPARLIAGATVVYGEEEMTRSYGEVIATPAERVRVVGDGEVIELAGRPLVCVDTPGHARHHLCIWDERSRGWFAGDTFGVSYRELDVGGAAFVIPTTTPVQFEPQPLKASIATLLARHPESIYLTHYGRVGEAARLGADLVTQIDAMVAIARSCDGETARHRMLVERLTALFLGHARMHGVPHNEGEILAVLEMDIELNARGLAVWLDRGRVGEH